MHIRKIIHDYGTIIGTNDVEYVIVDEAPIY